MSELDRVHVSGGHPEQLAEWGFTFKAWRLYDRWYVRIESDFEADHDTYHTAHGDTFDEAVAAAVAWWDGVKR